MTGRGRELADELKTRRIDIACIQETRWKGAKSRNIGEGYKLVYNGERKGENGVGIIVGNNLRDKITAVERISDRLMSIAIDANNITTRIISAYAPQTNCPEADKDRFWGQLDAHIRSIGPDEHIIIGGDLNGHVGASRDGYERCHGGNGYGPRNDDGTRILDCVEAHDLIVANTFFKKRTSHLVTYASGGRTTQIDFFIIRKRDHKLAMDVKVIPSVDAAPQHRLLVMDLRLEIGQRRPPKVQGPPRIKWRHLDGKKTELAAALNAIDVDLERPAGEVWSDLTNQLREAAASVLGRTKPGAKYIEKATWWWNEAVQEAVKEKKMARKQWRETNDQGDLQRYRSKKSAAKRAVAEAKRTHYDRLYEELDEPGGENKIYRIADIRHRATLDIENVRCIKDSNNRTLHDPTAILRRWSEYYEDICNQEFPHPPIISADPIAGAVAQINTAEVTAALKKMKNGKAPGPDDVPAEVWKLLGRRGSEILTTLFNRIIADGAAPHEWSTSVTVPIYKGKGDVAECASYRPIRLLCHAMKIFERVIDTRLRSIVQITPNQCGFMKGRSTTDAIFAARQLMEKQREKNLPFHGTFLDLEKAYDRIPWELIWHALRSHGVPEAYVSWIKILYNNTSGVVRTPSGTSPPFPITVGVHQGSAISPFIFILCMNLITADLQTPHPWSLLFADDVFLASTCRLPLEQQTQQWKNRLAEFGMRLNTKKTEYLELDPQTDGTITIDGEPLKKTSTFKYLGSTLTSDGNIDVDVRTRINAAWMKWRTVTGVLCDRRMPDRLKSKIYKSVVRPVALYGSECWPAAARHEQALNTMEMRMLRWSIGLTRWDRVTNVDVRKRLGVAPIVEKMRETRLRWYGHVMRSDEDSIARTALRYDPPGQRPRGRPKKRWMDRIKDDMKTTNAAPEDALDRLKWRRICRCADPATRDEATQRGRTAPTLQSRPG